MKNHIILHVTLSPMPLFPITDLKQVDKQENEKYFKVAKYDVHAAGLMMWDRIKKK